MSLGSGAIFILLGFDPDRFAVGTEKMAVVMFRELRDSLSCRVGIIRKYLYLCTQHANSKSFVLSQTSYDLSF